MQYQRGAYLNSDLTTVVFASLTSIGNLGKLNVPAASSITVTWHVYQPGFKFDNGTSNWNAAALRSGVFKSFASTSAVSYAFTLPLKNWMLVSTRTFPLVAVFCSFFTDAGLYTS